MVIYIIKKKKIKIQAKRIDISLGKVNFNIGKFCKLYCNEINDKHIILL